MPTPANLTNSIITVPYRVGLAGDQIGDLSQNTFLGIGVETKWNPPSDDDIPFPNNSTDYNNFVRKNLVAIKKVYASSCSLVVLRVDWAANTHYSAYSNSIDMFSTTSNYTANGTINVANGSTIIVGTNTTFNFDFANNDLVTIPGDGIYVLPQTREIVNVANATYMIVNNAFTATYTNNVAMGAENFAPYYAQNFYVRNSYDQVFVCLANNNGAMSTVAPQISLGGQLPSNPYIITSDGYLWKYLYTMSAGAKQLFFTNEYMPVSEDITVQEAAVSGRLDIILIKNGGKGYNGNVASFNAPILTVTGDGTGANLTAQVDANGTIYGINVLNGGEGYTVATITANVGANGSGTANLVAVIGPSGGWGSNAALELGATNIMVSVTLDDTENGTIPTQDYLDENFTYRQVALIDSPTFTANGAVPTGTNYDLTTVILCNTQYPFAMDDIVYQTSTNLNTYGANNTFQGTVVWFDATTNELHLNNISGTFNPNLNLYDANNSFTATAFSITEPAVDIFSGSVDFVENRAAVTRAPFQTENIKIILEF
jgi:hypothetical protein